MIVVRLPPHMEQQLGDLSEKTSRTKSFYVRLAIEKFLETMDRSLRIPTASRDPIKKSPMRS